MWVCWILIWRGNGRGFNSTTGEKKLASALDTFRGMKIWPNKHHPRILFDDDTDFYSMDEDLMNVVLWLVLNLLGKPNKPKSL